MGRNLPAATLLHCAVASAASPPAPSGFTPGQLALMDMGLAQFMHFSVDPWSNIEHNCVGNSPQCIPAAKFNPTNLSTDQWVEAAVAFGAGEICLTAHHEGGFCLWDTKYSDYSVMHSPYGKDVVAQFVASCKKYGVKPCYYMGPNANGYLSNEKNLSADAFVEAQLGMVRELLTKYGDNYVSRLWWDHYAGGCGGLAPCPAGSFPAAWPKFIDLVRQLSPGTVICPGPDCDGHLGEGGTGGYPVSYGRKFHPKETCATMHNGWFCKGACDDSHNSFWSPAEIWQHYMKSVGQGYVNTLNAPPGTTGRIPDELVANMKAFGDALRALLRPVTPTARAAGAALQCGAGADALELDLGAAVEFNAVMTREELSRGQRITGYAVDWYDGRAWKEIPQCGADCVLPGGTPPAPIPSTPYGSCGAVLDSVNLVSGAPPSTHMVAKLDDAPACEAKCKADPKCNFWTYHDNSTQNQGFARDCYVRYDTVFTNKPETHHFSGICNHTLTPASADGGVRGLSVGARVIDFVPNITASKVRLRCTATSADDGAVYIESFSVHKGASP